MCKCKFMLISRKKYHTACPSPLLLNSHSLERVASFKYLGVLLSFDLSWSQHIETICCKARKLLGLIYRRYFNHADTPTLLRLYISLVRPYLETAAPTCTMYLESTSFTRYSCIGKCSEICIKTVFQEVEFRLLRPIICL